MDEDGWRDGDRAKGRGELVGEETEMKGLTETQREMREREREREREWRAPQMRTVCRSQALGC